MSTRFATKSPEVTVLLTTNDSSEDLWSDLLDPG